MKRLRLHYWMQFNTYLIVTFTLKTDPNNEAPSAGGPYPPRYDDVVADLEKTGFLGSKIESGKLWTLKGTKGGALPQVPKNAPKFVTG